MAGLGLYVAQIYVLVGPSFLLQAPPAGHLSQLATPSIHVHHVLRVVPRHRALSSHVPHLFWRMALKEVARGQFVMCGGITFQRRARVEFPKMCFPSKVRDLTEALFYCTPSYIRFLLM
jgi:hypothetical protein